MSFLRAAWRHLVILSYRLPDALLEPYVPAGTTLDRQAGSAWASIVVFRFEGTRVYGLPVPLHDFFEEINLRCYVRRDLPGETRHGVVFIREAVPRPLIATAARLLFNEPYITMPMRSTVTGTPPSLRYDWELNGRSSHVAVGAAGPAESPIDGTLEHFLTMKNWGFTRRRDGDTLEYRVDHPLWRLWKGKDLEIDADWTALYGPEFGAALATPSSVLIAEGSSITIAQPHRMR